MLSTLNADQRAGLAGFLSIQAKAEKNPQLKTLLDAQSYGKIYEMATAQVIAASKVPPLKSPPVTTLPFSQQSFIDAGMMTPGLRNAHFFLIAIESSKNQEAINSITTALNTHCWAHVADQINERLTPDRRFSNSELQYANNPGDTAACSMRSPSGLATVLMPVIGAGVAVAGFFSGTLPDFFEGDFTNFFEGDVADFFTQDVAGFFTDDVAGFFTDDVANFFTEDVTGAFTGASESIVSVFEGGFEEFSDFFGGLF
jgi:hypothetical protein